MKRSQQIAVITILAFGVAGVGTLYADAHQTQTPAETSISQTLSGGPGANQQVALSEHGLAAINDIRLARVAVNDGFVDNAKNLLKEAHELLGQVKKEDTPIKVKTDIDVNGKQVKQDSRTVRADMIPILSDMQVVESYTLNSSKEQAANAHAASQDVSKKTANAETQKSQARSDAIAKANEHLSKGERTAAADTLRLVDLALVDQTVSMPLSETTQSVEHAMKLISQNKLHEANLALKKASDDLVLTTHVVAAPETGGSMGSGQPQHKSQG